MNNTKTEDDGPGFLNLLIILLSFYVLIALLVDAFVSLPPEISKLLNYIDNLVCLVFFYDFIVRFIQAENKLKFMKWGWIDLIASIPNLEILRAGRLLRVIRILRVIRAYKSVRHIIAQVFHSKVKGALTSVTFVAILVLIFSSIAILQVENHPDSNIKTAEDAIWWSYVTITTVGYGDKYPVTTEGRLIAVALMTVGVGLFGTFTAYVSSWFVKDNAKNN
ncbi:MAG: ion transporter [Bacteroidia bacterium]